MDHDSQSSWTSEIGKRPLLLNDAIQNKHLKLPQLKYAQIAVAVRVVDATKNGQLTNVAD
jgi:hypothetical protein